MKKIQILLFLSITTMTLLSGCILNPDVKNLNNKIKEKEEQIDSLNTIVKANEKTIEELQKSIGDLEVKANARSNSVLDQALIVINLMKNKDMKNLSDYVHPKRGVRFSPYGYIDEQSSIIIQADKLPKMMEDQTIFTWGAYDGSGENISLTYTKYYEQFVYDVDFASANIIGNNKIVSTASTSVNNLAQVYPKEVFVEFYFAGFDAQYAGMDWKSLKLVFENKDDKWYLVGIIHDQWTI